MPFVLCPECGAPNSELSVTCPRCGFPIGFVADRKRLVSLNFNPFSEYALASEDNNALRFEGQEWTEPSELVIESPDLPAWLYRLLCNNNVAYVRAVAAKLVTLTDDLVDMLAKDSSCCVREAIASNPATGSEILAKLADDQGYDDEDYSRSSSSVRCAVARNPNTDQITIEKLAVDEDASVRAAIASRKDSSQSVLMQLALDKTMIKAQVPSVNAIQNQNVSYNDSEWFSFRPMRNVSIQELVARNTSTGRDILEFLARIGDGDIRGAVASNPSASEETLALLAKDEQRSVRLLVAWNPSAGEAVLKCLAGQVREDGYPQWMVRRNQIDDELAFAIASNPSSTITVFESLQGLLNDRLARAIAENPSLDLEVLKRFSENEDAEFRAIAGRHRSATEDIMLRLAWDREENVRRAVATNDNITSKVAVILSKDCSASVRSTLASAGSPFLSYLLGDTDRSVLEHLARNRAADYVVLNSLANSDDSVLRCAVASNCSCTEDIIERLSHDDNSDVRCAVAGNRSTPIYILERLERDQNLEVRIAVAGRNAFSIAAVYELLAKVLASVENSSETLISEDDLKVLDTLTHNYHVPDSIKEMIVDEFDFLNPDDYCNDDSDSGYDPREDPLYGWHFDEDNGWLDYYPEE